MGNSWQFVFKEIPENNIRNVSVCQRALIFLFRPTLSIMERPAAVLAAIYLAVLVNRIAGQLKGGLLPASWASYCLHLHIYCLVFLFTSFLSHAITLVPMRWRKAV